MHPWVWLIVWMAGAWAGAVLLGRRLAALSATYPAPGDLDMRNDDEEWRDGGA